MNRDNLGAPAVIDGTVLYSRTTPLMRQQWAELRDDLGPADQPARHRRVTPVRWWVRYPFAARIVALLVLLVALLVGGAVTGWDDPSYSPPVAPVGPVTYPVHFAPVHPAEVAQLQKDIYSDQPQPSTIGLIPVEDIDVSARCWGDLLEAGFTGRTDGTEHVLWVDPDALITWCDQTEADAEFAETFEDETNGSGTWGPIADLDDAPTE